MLMSLLAVHLLPVDFPMHDHHFVPLCADDLHGHGQVQFVHLHVRADVHDRDIEFHVQDQYDGHGVHATHIQQSKFCVASVTVRTRPNTLRGMSPPPRWSEGSPAADARRRWY